MPRVFTVARATGKSSAIFGLWLHERACVLEKLALTTSDCREGSHWCCTPASELGCSLSHLAISV